jgi:hypothetical protein
MVRNLRIDELDEPVAFARSDERGEVSAGSSKTGLKLLMEEASMRRRRCDGTVDRSASDGRN